MTRLGAWAILVRMDDKPITTMLAVPCLLNLGAGFRLAAAAAIWSHTEIGKQLAALEHADWHAMSARQRRDNRGLYSELRNLRARVFIPLLERIPPFGYGGIMPAQSRSSPGL